MAYPKTIRVKTVGSGSGLSSKVGSGSLLIGSLLKATNSLMLQKGSYTIPISGPENYPGVRGQYGVVGPQTFHPLRTGGVFTCLPCAHCRNGHASLSIFENLSKLQVDCLIREKLYDFSVYLIRSTRVTGPKIGSHHKGTHSPTAFSSRLAPIPSLYCSTERRPLLL